jgi:hypothetical protein
MTLRPIERNGIVCVPCRSGGIPRIGKRGLYTVVLHTNTWAYDIEMKQFKSLIDICNNYNDDIVDFYYVANNYTSGFNLLQLAEEQRKITYERDIRPKLSKIKRKILKIGG